MWYIPYLKLVNSRKRLLYARQYKPRLLFFYPIFTEAAAYTADNLCTKQGNLGLKSMAYKQEQLHIKSGL